MWPMAKAIPDEKYPDGGVRRFRTGFSPPVAPRLMCTAQYTSILHS